MDIEMLAFTPEDQEISHHHMRILLKPKETLGGKPSED